MHLSRLMIFVLALAPLDASSCIADESPQTIELFNGKDFSGWTKRGGEATYSIEEGAIVGRSKPNTSNTFLATDKEYGDFELNLEFKIDDPTFNSGVQIRSHARTQGSNDRVYGYQVEIDPRTDRSWSGGLYFEAGSEARDAGWLNDLANNQAARDAFKLGEWNHLRIVARGRHIQTWINGVPAADFTDDDEAAFVPSGFIALQVHSVSDAKEPKEVRWRNIMLTNFGDPSAAAEAYGP
jgi:hypothetical protein